MNGTQMSYIKLQKYMDAKETQAMSCMFADLINRDSIFLYVHKVTNKNIRL